MAHQDRDGKVGRGGIVAPARPGANGHAEAPRPADRRPAPAPRGLAVLRRDVAAALARDPAARGPLEVILFYPGLHALWGHRIAHRLWRRGDRLLARALSQLVRFLTNIEIHPGATIGPGLFIDHGAGVVIGETAVVGADVTIYHGVTLGGVSLARGKRHPTLEDRVVVGAGAKILGAIVVGAGSRIGANAVVVKSVPPDSVVVGVPGQVIARSRQPVRPTGPDLAHNQLPDPLAAAYRSLLERVEELERRLGGPATARPVGRRPAAPPYPDVWRGEDFSI